MKKEMSSLHMEIPFFSTAAFSKVCETQGKSPPIQKLDGWTCVVSVSGKDYNTFEELSSPLSLPSSWTRRLKTPKCPKSHLLPQVLSASDTVSLLLVPSQASPGHGKATLNSCPEESCSLKQRGSHWLEQGSNPSPTTRSSMPGASCPVSVTSVSVSDVGASFFVVWDSE